MKKKYCGERGFLRCKDHFWGRGICLSGFDQLQIERPSEFLSLCYFVSPFWPLTTPSTESATPSTAPSSSPAPWAKAVIVGMDNKYPKSKCNWQYDSNCYEGNEEGEQLREDIDQHGWRKRIQILTGQVTLGQEVQIFSSFILTKEVEIPAMARLSPVKVANVN